MGGLISSSHLIFVSCAYHSCTQTPEIYVILMLYNTDTIGIIAMILTLYDTDIIGIIAMILMLYDTDIIGIIAMSIIAMIIMTIIQMISLGYSCCMIQISLGLLL